MRAGTPLCRFCRRLTEISAKRSRSGRNGRIFSLSGTIGSGHRSHAAGLTEAARNANELRMNPEKTREIGRAERRARHKGINYKANAENATAGRTEGYRHPLGAPLTTPCRRALIYTRAEKPQNIYTQQKAQAGPFSLSAGPRRGQGAKIAGTVPANTGPADE